MLNLPKLDSIDISILAELHKNGRVTNAQLADLVGLTPSPCLARVRRLEDAGYISGYSAHLNLAKLGTVQTIFATVILADRRDFTRFEKGIREYGELVESHMVKEEFDYLLKFAVRSIPHYQKTVETLLEKNIGISKISSYVVMKSLIVKKQQMARLTR